MRHVSKNIYYGRTFGIMKLRGRLRLSESRTSDRSSQIFCRAPKAPWSTHDGCSTANRKLINCAKYTVAFQDVSPGSQIQKQQNRRGKLFFVAINFTKRKKFFLFQQVQKNLHPFTKGWFLPKKTVTKLSDMGRGSGIRTKLIPDPDTGVKRHRITAICTELCGGNLMTILISICRNLHYGFFFWFTDSKRNTDLGTVTYFQSSYRTKI